MSSSESTTYVLKGYGDIDPVWVQECFQLFKLEAVNIRKLLLLKNGNPSAYAMIEIHFALPPGGTVNSKDAFLSRLHARLEQQLWSERSLLPL